MPKIVIAPNSFKGSLSAFEICQGLSKGLKKAIPDIEIKNMPVADGGDLTMEVLVEAMNGKKETVTVKDPLGRNINAEYGLLPNNTAVIEMAQASGIWLLKENELNPLITSTYGTGQLIIDALQKGCKKIIMGIGGSATVDGGTGILKALGVKFFDKGNNELPEGGGALNNIEAIDTNNIHPLLKDCEISILCDVENTLLGEFGAARVFGPQKGADKKMVDQLETSLTRFCEVSLKKTGVDMSKLKHGGAAGGISASLSTFLNAKVVSGINFLLDYIDINTVISNSDLVITSEGKLDSQTIGGKAPYGVALRAKKYNKPVVFVGGQVPKDILDELNIFDASFSIINGPQSLEEAMSNSPTLIETFGYNLGKILSISIIK